MQTNTLRAVVVGAVSSIGLALAMLYEGVRLNAYQDEVGVWTVCYGHTKGVKKGDSYTKAQCELLLKQDMAWAEGAVRRNVKVAIGQNQFDALSVFVFNVGEPSFKTSTLLKKVNARDCWGAATEFARWSNLRDVKTGKLRPSAGLLNRRNAEMKLFTKDCK